MPRFKEAYIHQRARLLLESYWRPNIVAKDARTSRLTAYRWERNTKIYSDTVIPRSLYTLGRPYKLLPAVIEALLEYQRQKPWLYQDELARFLLEEWEI